MAWVYLILAGLFEIVWASAMKGSEGFTKPGPTAVMLVAMVVSFVLLAMAMRALPLGTAYAMWTGIGALGTFCVGIFLLGEAATFARVLSASLILAGLVGLKLTS